jgi:hypothetical protein
MDEVDLGVVALTVRPECLGLFIIRAVEIEELHENFVVTPVDVR